MENQPAKTILVAEDNPDDAFIFKMMFRKASLPYQLHMVEDGQQVINWLDGKDGCADRLKCPLPDLLILDLKMPIKSGFEVLEWMRQDPRFKSLHALILSSSDDPKDLRRANDLRVSRYFIKSPHLRDVMQYLKEN
jgi:CheY-like chemotaxis protein